MVNVFGQQQASQPSANMGEGTDDVKDAVMKLLAQQQANEPAPRPPTPQEMDQLKQTAMQVAQAKKTQGGGAAFMGMGGLNPSYASQQTPTPSAPTQPPPSPPGGGFKDWMTSPLWGNHDLLATKEEQGKFLDTMTTPRWFTPGKPGVDAPGYVPGTGDVPTKLPGKMVPEKPVFDPSQEVGQAPPPEDTAKGQQASAGMDDLLKMAQTKGGAPQDDFAAHAGQMAKVAPEARKVADHMVSNGVDSPDKADTFIRAKFAGDPELDNAIAEARATYDEIHKQNNQPPSVIQYIGAVLVALAGGRPEIVSHILRPNAQLNAQREQQTGENLLKLQLAKAHGMQQNQMLQAKQGDDSLAAAKLDQQWEMMKKREEGLDKRQGAAQHLNDLKETINFYKQEAEKHDEAATKSVGDSKKKHIQAADQARREVQPFIQMLQNEIQQRAEQMKPKAPQQPAGGNVSNPTSMGQPQGQVSQGAMRLLGMGA